MSLLTVKPRRSAADVHYGTAAKPRAFTTYVSSNNYGTGATHTPTTPNQLATILNGGTLAAGDTIVLVKGTCYNDASNSTFKFPVLAGGDVTATRIITSDLAAIPAPGNRRNRTTHRNSVTNFRKINTNVPFSIAAGAAGYQFVGIDVDAGSWSADEPVGIVHAGPVARGAWDSVTNYAAGDLTYDGWISVQNGNLNHAQVVGPWWRQIVLSDLTSGIVFDRCDIWIRNHSNRGRLALYGETRNFTLIGNTIGNEGYTGMQEAKAVAAVNAAGPWRVENNEILAPGIPILFGGAPPGFDTYVTDCVITRNVFGQLTRWLPNHGDWDTLGRKHKNCFEIKVGERFDIYDNVIQNGFDNTHSSQYHSVVFKNSNGSDDLGQPGFDNCQTGDITFRHNRLLNVNGLFNLGAQDNYNGGPLPAPVHDVSIYQNYTDGLYGGGNTGVGKLAHAFAVKSTILRLHIEHITCFGDYTKANCQMLFLTDGGRPDSLTFRNIIGTWGNQYGAIWSSGFTYTGSNCFGAGTSSASAVYIHDATNQRPGSVGPSTYNAYTVSTNADSMVTDFAGGDWTTAAALTGVGYGGRTPGCDINTVRTRTTNTLTGVFV